MYCTCHAKGSQAQEALCTAPRRKPAAGQRRPCAPQILQEALCTAPAMPKAARKLSILHRPCESQPRASGAHARRNSCRRLRVLRLPRQRQPGSSLYCTCHAKASRGPAAPTRAAAPPGGSVYCACQAKGSEEALCTAPATPKAGRKLSVLHLPHDSQPRASGAYVRRSSSRRLCAVHVLHLPHKRQPGSSLYCACLPPDKWCSEEW